MPDLAARALGRGDIDRGRSTGSIPGGEDNALVGWVELGEPIVVPQQPEPTAGDNERNCDLRVHLREAARQVADIKKAVLKLSQAEQTFLRRRIETLSDGPRGLALNRGSLNPAGARQLTQENPARGVAKRDRSGRAIDGHMESRQLECDRLRGFTHVKRGTGDFFRKDQTRRFGCFATDEAHANGVIQQRLDGETATIDRQC